MPNTSVPKQSGATSSNTTKIHDENSIADSNCVLTTNQSMVEWEEQRKICYLVKSRRKHIWNSQLIHLREVLRDKNGDWKSSNLECIDQGEK